MNNGEKLLNERFKFKKDEPVVEESKEAGAEEYVYMGLWDYNKFPLPQAIYVKKNRYYITQVSTTLDDGRAVNVGDWIMADGEKWHIITPELAEDDDVCRVVGAAATPKDDVVSLQIATTLVALSADVTGVCVSMLMPVRPHAPILRIVEEAAV